MTIVPDMLQQLLCKAKTTAIWNGAIWLASASHVIIIINQSDTSFWMQKRHCNHFDFGQKRVQNLQQKKKMKNDFFHKLSTTFIPWNKYCCRQLLRLKNLEKPQLTLVTNKLRLTTIFAIRYMRQRLVKWTNMFKKNWPRKNSGAAKKSIKTSQSWKKTFEVSE